MTKWLLLLSFAFLISASAAGEINPKYGCKGNPEVVDTCFTVHGRISVYNGTPSVRLWPVGTKQLIGILPSEHEIMPDSVKKRLDATTMVYGDFLVCPFTKAKEGQMQFGCIETASNVNVREK